MRSAVLCGCSVLWAAMSWGQTPSLAGKWNWGATGGVVEIHADGSGRDPAGHTLQWTLRDAAARTYLLRWNHGYTDTATLAADGNSLSAVNNNGLRFTATRFAGAGAIPAAGSGAAIAGQWNWGAISGVVEIHADGTGRDPAGHTLRWTIRDAAARAYTLSWSHGYTDTATLSADGATLNAVNNNGMRFTATRRGGTPAPAAGPLDLNGTWSGGLHIWQDGAQALVTASWKRDDGRYVVWRGEGRLTGRTLDLAIRYSPMTHGPQPEWRGTLTVSADGNTIEAVYSVAGAVRDRRTYSRER